jgi:hypothetical protein
MSSPQPGYPPTCAFAAVDCIDNPGTRVVSGREDVVTGVSASSVGLGLPQVSSADQTLMLEGCVRLEEQLVLNQVSSLRHSSASFFRFSMSRYAACRFSSLSVTKI